jgi:inner membrane protein
MDNLTHTAVGLFLSRAGLNRWTPRATAILLLAANAPDIDVVSSLGGSLNYLHYHRLWTHSLIAMPVLAAAVAVLVRSVGTKPIHWRGAFAAGLLGIASHLLLDWTNVYGIRLLWPFSTEWLRLDITGVIDLWIWAVLLLGIVAPFLAKLVGSEITSNSLRPKYHGRTAAIFALVFVLLYDCGRAVLHARAVATLDSRLYGDARPGRVAAVPGFANPLRWRGLVETPDFYAVADVDLVREFDPSRAAIYQKPEPGPAIEAARRTYAFQEFQRFSQFPLWRVLPVPEPEGGTEVDIIDLRFGTPVAPGFMVSAVLDSQFRPVRTWVQFGGVRASKAD